jgi:hypothetical protein
MNKTLKKWRSIVEWIENKMYVDDDEFEFENDLATRKTLESEKLTDDEKLELTALDERFKQALYPALREAKLLNIYYHRSNDYPIEEWWWHVKEE